MLDQRNVDFTRSPLAVDLDRTLLVTDTLVEQFLTIMFRHPWRALKALVMLRKGRAVFKQAVPRIAMIDVDALLFNQHFVAYLHGQIAGWS